MKLIDYDVDQDRKIVLREEECSTFNTYGVTNVGFNGPKIVDINGVKGFLKTSENTTGTFDKFEYLISKLGKCLNVNMADEYLVRDDEKLMLFSKSVIDSGEELIMSSEIYLELLKNGVKTEDELRTGKAANDKFNESLSPAGNDKSYGYLIQDDQIGFVINQFIEKIKPLNLPNYEEIFTDYIKMCFFDALIGNKDRNDNNFGLIKKSDNSYTFAPLFDSSTISIPGVPDNVCRIGNYCIDSKSLIKYLLITYPDYLNSMLISNVDDIRDFLTQMSTQILDERQYEWFQTVILNRLKQENFEMLKEQRS